MSEKNNKLAVIDGETLMDTRLEPTKFCIDTLLPQGITILGGAPKIGKSWWVLDICIRIAKGESVWDMPTTKGTTLYLCLEDTLRRVQERLCLITDDVPSNAFFATAANTLAEGFCDEIRTFVKEYPGTILVAIDTFQIVRNGGVDTSYGNDYDEIRQMKQLADELNISLLPVHHLRKQVLDEIVLGRVQKMTAFAREKPEEFYAMATANGETEAKKFYAMAERQKSSLENRVKEIDKIIRCLYEDRVVGRITPERYDELACGYELEQAEIKQELESISAKIAEMDMREICIKEFIEKAKEIEDMDKLTPKILRAFVLRIDVYEKTEKFSRKCGNPIKIHYTFQPKPRTTSETAISTIAVIPMELQMAALNA